MYLAHDDGIVYGTSFLYPGEAWDNAVDWCSEEYDMPKESISLKLIEIEVPETAIDNDFLCCSDVKEYEKVAEMLREVDEDGTEIETWRLE